MTKHTVHKAHDRLLHALPAARGAEPAAQAERFGIHAGPLQADGRAVMARVRAERDRFVGFVIDAVEHWPAEHRLQGHARVIDDRTLQVGPVRVQADRIVIATGSSPVVPALRRERLIVNDDVFEWQHLPRSVTSVAWTAARAHEHAQ